MSLTPSPGAPTAEVLRNLRSAFPSDFFSDAADDLRKYGADWSGVFEPAPSLIAFPRSTEEVARLLSECTRLGIQVVPSGGRTGLSGGAVAARGELVLSLERMSKIGRLDPQALTLEVQAGAVTEAVHEAAKPFGLTWPVDFASKGSSQVGGNLSTNAGGVRVIRYGLTRNWVLGLTVVTMDGEVLRLNGALEKNNTGIDLRQVFIGAEGTLGVITEALLKLAPLPNEENTRVCFFALRDISAVLDLFARARGPAASRAFTLSAFECLSAACLREVVGFGLRSPFLAGSPGSEAGAYVLMEVETESAENYDLWLGEVLASGRVVDATAGQSPRENAELWALRERVAEAVMLRREVHQQDLSVPIALLAAFFSDIEERYRTAYPDFEVFLFGHIGDGNLHIFIRRPEDMPSAEFHARCAESDTMLFELCRKFHGSVSAEHGVGLLKKPALPYSRGEAELTYVRALKKVFDPRGLMNPGKMI